MATKQEKAIQRAVARTKKQGKIREEKHILWFLIGVILVLLYLLFAQHNAWWPYARPSLGTAFYTNVSSQAAKPASVTSASGTVGSAGGSDDGSGATSTPSSGGDSAIWTFASGVNVGNTKEQTGGQANGLNQNCAVIANANASTGGKQEVCTYSQGNKIVTVTYLDDHVVSASKSGF